MEGFKREGKQGCVGVRMYVEVFRGCRRGVAGSELKWGQLSSKPRIAQEGCVYISVSLGVASCRAGLPCRTDGIGH